MSPTRRQFLATSGATLAAVVGVGSVSATDDFGWLPGHVTQVGDDPDELERYQPRLVTNAEDRQKMVGMFGWYADSSVYDTRAYYYWLKYTHQDSVLDSIPLVGGIFAADAHLGDHEPYIAFVNTATGEVERVVYTGYHHYAVELDADNANLSDGYQAGVETHTPLEVVTPHHHYRLADEGRGVLASNITSMDSFLDAYPTWDRQGIFDNSNEETVRDPWEVKSAGHWWDEGTIDYRLASIRIALNWRDAGDRDELIRD